MPTKQKRAKKTQRRKTAAKKTQPRKTQSRKTQSNKSATKKTAKKSARNTAKKAARKQAPQKLLPTNDSAAGYPFKVVHSPVHGRGIVATEPIADGERIIEYVGEKITPAEADRRYPFVEGEPQHTFLFSVSDRVIIDASSGGNVSRFINHSCDPNCEAEIERGRVFIHAIRNIEPGEELGYDYWFVLEEPHNKKNKELYKCNCGAKNCRGTMLADKRKARDYLAP